MDWTLYWFMFPIAIGIAMVANLSGIGGTALFTPIFLLVFPWLGAEYPLSGPIVAFATALFTACCGFGSGLYGYARARLVDYQLGFPYAAIAAPAAVVGALYAQSVDPDVLRLIYAGTMVLLGILLAVRKHLLSAVRPSGTEFRVRRSLGGQEYRYSVGRMGWGGIPSASGGLMTGMLSVGMGEVLMPQLIRRGVAFPVAAATSVFVVVVVFVSATLTHLIGLDGRVDGPSLPWHLLVYTVPGVILGGQLAPRLQGRIPEGVLVHSMVALFFTIAVGMVLSVWLRG